MNDRITRQSFLDSGGLAALRTTTGRSLADVGAAAIARKRYVVGIDPGVKTGFAVWDRNTRSLVTVQTLDFWGVFLKLQEGFICDQTDALIVIEAAHYAPVFRERKAKGQNENHAARLAQNVGQVMREAKLLAEGLRRLGYEVIEQKPLGKKKDANGEYSAEADRAEFERLTGWTERTSQHARDAARICFQR